MLPNTVAATWEILVGSLSDEWGIHGYENSLDLCLPPLSVMVFKHDAKKSLAEASKKESD